jgi:hypothetical protein
MNRFVVSATIPASACTSAELSAYRVAYSLAHAGPHGHADRGPPAGLSGTADWRAHDQLAYARDYASEALKRKLKKDISLALRRGTITQVTTALDAAQRAAEAELAVNEVGLAW